MDIFERCSEINVLIESDDFGAARDLMIQLLDYLNRNNVKYNPVVNHLIRRLGLYPYLDFNTSSWSEKFIFEVFKVDVGSKEKVTLHKEQSKILKKLKCGESLALSAPTSFGKSFIIDAYISINQPKNVVIIVPTIALTDETRRRLQKKFSNKYKIITTVDVELAERNILVFPQERVKSYLNKINEIDILIVDEFYKASEKFDKERSSSLINAIIKLGKKANQKYFLAPNISRINDNIFTKDMEFVNVDFNTVFLEKHELYQDINGDENLKSIALTKILDDSDCKTLIYAGTYSNIDKVSNLIIDRYEPVESALLKDFELWLIKNYHRNWHLTNLVKRGCGIHNGQLHRSLSQIQVRLFEDEAGLKNIVTTSSIIEGVNTSAENVVVWKNKNGNAKLTDFTYRNIIGRSGRMFKHFIGKVFILEKPPIHSDTELDLTIPDELIGNVDIEDFDEGLTKEQIAKIISYKEEMSDLLGSDNYNSIKTDYFFESTNSYFIRDIARDLKLNPEGWNGIGYLNSNNPNDWDRILYKVINMHPGGWGIEYGKFVSFIKIISNNWFFTLPELLNKLDNFDINVDDFFKLERNVTFKLSSTLNDINILQNKILDKPIDISPFISRISNAFLPSNVYKLEEYGLPRMISRKIQDSCLINLEDDKDFHELLHEFKIIGKECLIAKVNELDRFDKYIIDYFYDGI